MEYIHSPLFFSNEAHFQCDDADEKAFAIIPSSDCSLVAHHIAPVKLKTAYCCPYVAPPTCKRHRRGTAQCAAATLVHAL